MRFWVKGIRLCVDTGEHCRERAERRMRAIYAREEGKVMLSAGRNPVTVSRIDLTCSVCGKTDTRTGAAAYLAISLLRRGTHIFCSAKCRRLTRYQVEKAQRDNWAAAQRAIADLEKEVKEKNEDK